MSAPRTFTIRHGETEWSRSLRHTGRTDLPLTENGEQRMAATGKAVVGKDKLISPDKIVHVYCSPRKRAQKTLELLGLEHKNGVNVEITEDLREWDYGDYGGLTAKEIGGKRKAKGLDKDRKRDIWRDGCEGGESPEQIAARVDNVILDIRSRFQTRDGVAASENVAENAAADVLCVAHGHLLIAFAMRWVGMPLTGGPRILLEAGGVGILSYDQYDVEEPAILLGGGFLVNAVENIK